MREESRGAGTRERAILIGEIEGALAPGKLRRMGQTGPERGVPFPMWIHVLKPYAEDGGEEWEGKIAALKKDIRALKLDVPGMIKHEVDVLSGNIGGVQNELGSVRKSVALMVKREVGQAVRNELAGLRDDVSTALELLNTPR